MDVILNIKGREEMEGYELLSFTIISNVGSAKSKVMESMELARGYQFSEAQQAIEEANLFLQEGEKAHFSLITKDTQEKEPTINLLVVHAEDQLMTTVCLRDLAVELLQINKNMFAMDQKLNQLIEKE